MKVNLLLALFITFVFSSGVAAQIPGLMPQKNWELNGYLTYLSTVNLVDNDENTVNHLIEQRLNYEYRFNQQFHFNGSLRNRSLFGDGAEQLGYGDWIADDSGYLDLSSNSVDKNGLVINHQLDRLYLDYSNPDWQLRGGRFRINWAMNTIWNPNDIFNAYSIYDFDYTERAGSDAFLVQRKLGFASAIEAVYNPNKKSELNGYAGRYLFNQQGWDMQLLAGKANLDYLFGAGFAGDIKGAGVRGELTWLQPAQDEWHDQAVQQSLLVSLESDYSFVSQANWMVNIALLYITTPQSMSSALQFLNLPLTARTLSFAEFTYYADVSFDLSALSRVTLSSSYYSDGSIFIGLSDRYSLADNWQLLAVLQRFMGSSASLFGKTPYLSASAQIKWSF